MGLGVGIVLIAAGAVMKWGITTDRSDTFDLDAIGTILFVIGLVALLVSLAFWSSWGGGNRVRRRTVSYDQEGPVVAPAAPAAPVGRPVSYDSAGRPFYYDAAGRPVYYDVPPEPRRAVVREEIRDSRF